ncbi:MAG: hypothetical protein RR891_03820 [Clostridium sp.]
MKNKKNLIVKNKVNLIWISKEDNAFTIGEVLNCDRSYYFSYNQGEVKRAVEEGFELLLGFPRVNSKYFSEENFKLFTGWAKEYQKVESKNFEMLKGLTHGAFRFEEVMEVDNEEAINVE